MTPSFFALCSKAGIACASDVERAFYPLSDKLPVAIAVNPASPIPWDRIIQRYKDQLEPTPQAFFVNYANEFDLFLSTLETEESWKGLSSEESNIIFLGYGEDDIFPSVYDVYVQIDKDGMMGLSEGEVRQVTLEEPALIHMLGDFEYVSPLLFGRNERVRDFLCEGFRPVWNGYVERVAELVEGKSFEKDLVSKLRDYDCTDDICGRVDSATGKTYDDMTLGISTFSVEDLVSTVEAVVDANARFSHLMSGAPGRPGGTKEIAVITIPEGISWIKHSHEERRK